MAPGGPRARGGAGGHAPERPRGVLAVVAALPWRRGGAAVTGAADSPGKTIGEDE